MRSSSTVTLLAATALLSGCASGHGDGSSGLLDDDVAAAVDRLPGAEVAAARDGVPTFLAGDLGRAGTGKLDEASARTALPAVLAGVAPAFRLAATDLRLTRVDMDEDGALHARYQQTQYGIDVDGAELLLHAGVSGAIYAVNGSARGGSAPSMQAEVAAADAVSALLASPAYRGMAATPPELAFVQDSARAVRLAWRTTVTGSRDGAPVEDVVYVDAHSGRVAATAPEVQSALRRGVYTVDNGQAAPGTLRRAETDPATGDSVVDDVHRHLGETHGCYRSLFSRDSYDGKGGALSGVVHYGVNTLNAFYRGGGMMVFGDGDARNSGPFGTDLDIVAHELTHGVTRETSNLRYEDDSGAINEAMSDVFGAICETWVRRSITADTWKIGELSTTPGIPNDALRYMDDPARDGISRDYYPERYSGTHDNGGVHFNSGIANLAFKLLVTGGSHPRGKTSVVVPAIGMEQAGRIFYRANTTYLTPTSAYPDLRAATEFAARELYGDATGDAVATAWTAVGVADPGRPVPPSSPVTVLTPGGERQLSGEAGKEQLFAIDVPAGARQLAVELRGGTGDLDLFVKREGSPTLFSSDHVSANLGSSDERIFVASPQAGRWYILATASSAYAGVSLRARTAGSEAQTRLDAGRWVTLAGDRRAARSFTVEVPAGARGLTVELDGQGGDADLFVRRDAAATATSHDAASTTQGSSVESVSLDARAGVYHILVAPAAGADGFEQATLRASALPATTLRLGDSVAVSGGAGSAQLFVVEDVPAAAVLELVLEGGTGDGDLYVGAGGPPTDRRFDWASYNPENAERVLLPGAVAGDYQVAVYAASAFEGATLTARVHASLDSVDPTLVPDHAATVALAAGDALRFTLEAPPTALDGAFAFAAGQGAGVDVYVKHGAPATVADHDLDTEGLSDKRIAVAPMAAGLWHVLVVAARDATGRLAASVNATPAMREGRALVLSGLRGNRKILRYDAPAGARGASFTLSGGTGDADLYVKQGQAPTLTDHDGASEASGNDEQVTVAAGGGTYYVLIVAAGDYSLGRLVAAQAR